MLLNDQEKCIKEAWEIIIYKIIIAKQQCCSSWGLKLHFNWNPNCFKWPKNLFMFIEMVCTFGVLQEGGLSRASLPAAAHVPPLVSWGSSLPAQGGQLESRLLPPWVSGVLPTVGKVPHMQHSFCLWLSQVHPGEPNSHAGKPRRGNVTKKFNTRLTKFWTVG